MKRSLLLAPAALALVGVLVGCSEKTPGSPVPDSTTQATSSSPGGGPFTETPTESSTTQSQAASPLKNVDPCSLLSPSEAASLSAGTGHYEKVNEARACRFTEAKGFKMSVAIFDNLGLDDITATGPIAPVPTVGKHKAVKSMFGDGCAVSIEVATTTRVDTQATFNDPNPTKSCEIALQVANLVEPKLP